MITINQLLESVDLDFEPRFVTKDADGEITIYSHRPTPEGWCAEWREYEGDYKTFGELKLSEFANKHWTECIYEVPRKVDPFEEYKKWVGKLCLFGFVDEGDAGYMILEKFNDTSIICGNRFIASDNIGYRFCEPVRPDDDVIYKGE